MSGDLVKIAVIVLIAALVVSMLRTRLQEYAFLLLLATVCTLLVAVLVEIFPYISKLRSIFEKSGSASTYFSVSLKALGISYITNFAGDVCRDFGLSSLAQVVEIAGKGAVFIISIPLVISVLDVAIKFVEL